MKSITNVVETKYGQGDVPYPVFRCPVVIDGQVLSVLAAADNATFNRSSVPRQTLWNWSIALSPGRILWTFVRA